MNKFDRMPSVFLALVGLIIAFVLVLAAADVVFGAAKGLSNQVERYLDGKP